MRLMWILKVVTALAIVGSLGACSRGDHTSVGSSEKVTIAYSTSPDSALAQIAQTKGYYLQEGLDAVPQKHAYGKVALDAVLEGKADFATVAETPVMFAIMKGEKISVIASIHRSNSTTFVIARKDRGIHNPQDLKGRKIAVTSGTILEFYLDSFLATNGLPRKAVTVVDMRPEDMADAVARGDVDAISAWSHHAIEAQERLGDKGITFLDKDIYTKSFVVVAREEFIRRNPKKVSSLLRAFIRAEEFARANPAEAQATVAEFCQTDKAVIARFWAAGDCSVTLDQLLILALEDESRWAIKNKLANATKLPNYLDYIYLDGRRGVKPDAVRILR